MSTAQRVSRGFHRLAVFLAALPLVVGLTFSLMGPPYQRATDALERHNKLVCARQNLSALLESPARHGLLSDEQAGFPLELNMIGCSKISNDTVSYAEARNPANFNWWLSFLNEAWPIFAVAGVISLIGYGVIRSKAELLAALTIDDVWLWLRRFVAGCAYYAVAL